jgi:hypothetical protein
MSLRIKGLSALLVILMLTACAPVLQEPMAVHEEAVGAEASAPSLVNPEGMAVGSRFSVPPGFEREPVDAGSFEAYLRQLPLKAHGAPVLHFDGTEKRAAVHAGVVAMDIGNRDLQQCADAVIRLRAEYLYHNGQSDRIAFNFTSGFTAEYSRWADGERISVQGNEVQWKPGGAPGDDYQTLRSYLNMVFAYAGTLSLERELVPAAGDEIRIGDVFIQGGSPGHCVIVVDKAADKDGNQRFLLAQSYMPAQDIHILKNPAHDDEDPWFEPGGDALVTPQWRFQWSDRKRFQE